MIVLTVEFTEKLLKKGRLVGTPPEVHLSRLDALAGIWIDKMPLPLFYPALRKKAGGCSNNLGHNSFRMKLPGMAGCGWSGRASPGRIPLRKRCPPGSQSSPAAIARGGRIGRPARESVLPEPHHAAASRS